MRPGRSRIPARMTHHVRYLLAVAAAALLCACGSTSIASHPHSPTVSGSAAGSTPTAASTPGAAFPSPAPGVTSSVPAVSLTCASTPPAGAHLALVTLRNVSGIVVRDITDLAHPVTRCTFGGGQYFRFFNTTHVSYVVAASRDQGAPGALYLADLTTQTTSLVRAWTYGGFASWVYNWSPNGQYLSYIKSDQTGAEWHLLSAGGDRMLSSLGAVVPRGLDPNGDDQMVGFSADGQYVAIEQTFTGGKGGNATTPIQVNRISDGSLAYSRTDGTMAAWAGAGARLLFRTTAGVQAWSPGGGVTTVSAGTTWVHPVASPDGARIAFSVLNAQTNHIGQVVDLTTGAIHQLSPNPRVGAAFLNASLVWYAGEDICTTATPCPFGIAPLTGKTYLYDLGSDVETGSVDTGFYDSWPHVVGQ